jgi:MFS family permease
LRREEKSASTTLLRGCSASTVNSYPTTEAHIHLKPVPLHSFLKKINLSSLASNIIPLRLNVNAKLFLTGGAINGFSNGIFNAVMQLFMISLGYNAQNLGYIFMMNSLASTFLAVPAGLLGDRYGKRKMILTGAIVVTISMILFFIAHSVEVFAFAFLLIGVCNASATVFAPLYSSFFEDDDMNKAFGLWGLLNVSAMSAGSLVGYVPQLLVSTTGLSLVVSYRYTMMLGGSLFVLQYLFYIMSCRGVNENLSKDIAFKLKSRKVVIKLCLVMLLINVSGGIMFSFFPFYVNKKFGVESAALGTLFFVSNLFMAFSKGAAATFSRRFGILRSISLGVASSALFFIALPLSPSFGILSMMFVLRQCTRFMSDPLISSLFMRSVAEDERSTANSIMTISNNGGGAISLWLGGNLMEKVSLDSPAFIGGVATLALGFILPLILKKEAEKLDKN